MAIDLKSLPGFRDFYPADCQVRNYLMQQWRQVAKNYGFVEYQTPYLEYTNLYLEKTGGELTTQLFNFQDKGEREVTLRPEVTASLARMVIAQERNYPKPIKWFEIGPCFRYEKPQKGRGREFYQFNLDIFGVAGVSADVEIISLAIDMMLQFGFKQGDFILRLSDRAAWQLFAQQQNLSDEQLAELLPIIDRYEKLNADKLQTQLDKLGLQLDTVNEFIALGAQASPNLIELSSRLEQRGLADYIDIDLKIVRGLAYYNSTVFEIFDCKHGLRAIAGGGRYDNLLSGLSDGKVDLPAVGFGMGDQTPALLIDATPHAKAKMEQAILESEQIDYYIVIADEDQRVAAEILGRQLRNQGRKVLYNLEPMNVGKQFKKAEQSQSKKALVIGAEYPQVQLKTLATREEQVLILDETVIASL